MFKKLMSSSYSKSIIIGLALVIISVLIIFVSNTTKNTGMIKSDLDAALSYNGLEDVKEDNIGKYTTISYNTYSQNNKLYCIQHGKNFNGSINAYIAAKYFINNANVEVKEPSKTSNRTVKGEENIKYHIAVLHVLAEARNTANGNPISYYKNAASGNNTNKEYDRYQRALWAVMYYYYQNKESDNGYADGTYKITDVNSQGNPRDYAATAMRAITFAEFIDKNDNKSPTNATVKESVTTVKETNDYVVKGPYKIEFPTASKEVTGWKLHLGELKNVKYSSNGMVICDREGRKIPNITSGQEFYIRIPDNVKDTKQTVAFTFEGFNVKGSYYKLVTGTEDQNLVYYIDGKIEDKDRKVTLTINGEKEDPASITLNWQKTNEGFNSIIQKESSFQYSLNNGKNKTISKNGEFTISNINIDIDKYDNLETVTKDGSSYKLYTINLKEKEAPEGYKKIDGDIVVNLYLQKTKKTENGTTTTTIKVKRCEITNNTTKTIQINNSVNIGSNKTKKITGISKNNYTIPLIKVPNKEIEKVNYELELNKLDENGNGKDGAEFEIDIRGEQDINSNVEADKYTIGVTADFNTSSRYVRERHLNGGFISNKLNVSKTSLNDIINFNGETGKVSLNLEQIDYDGKIYFTINEIKAPGKRYKKLSDPIKLCVTINDGEIGVEFVNENQVNGENKLVEVVTTDKTTSINTTIKVKNLLQDVPEGNAQIKINKLDNENNNLQGVKFDLYEVKNNNQNFVNTVTTKQDGLTDNLNISYKALPTSQEGTWLEKQEYIIKEIETADGYIKLGDNEQIKVITQGIVKIVDGVRQVIPGYMHIFNNTNQEIRFGIETSTGSSGQTEGISSQSDVLLYSSDEIVRNNNSVINQIECSRKISASNLNERALIIKLANSKAETGTYNFTLRKVDSSNNNQTIEGVKFALYAEEDYKAGVNGNAKAISDGYTNSQGILTLSLPLNKEGTFSYIIKEVETSNGYILLNDASYIALDVKVVCNNNRFEVDEIEVYNMLVQGQEDGNRVIKVNNIELAPFSTLGDASESKDEVENISEDTYIIIDDSISDNSTDNDGTIDSGDINAEASSTEEENVIDDTSYQALYNSDKDQAGSNSKTIVRGSELNMTISIPNDKIPEGTYKIGIQKVDKNGNIIKGSKFKFKSEDETSYYNTTEITSNGYKEYLFNITDEIYSKKSITYHLEEETAPDGYKNITGQVDIKATFNKEGSVYNTTLEIINNTSGIIKVNGNDVNIGDTRVVNNGLITIQVINEEEDKIDLSLKKFIDGVRIDSNTYIETRQDRQPNYSTSSLYSTTEAVYKFGNRQNLKTELQPVEVSTGNIVTYGIRIYNEGKVDGYASLIKDYLPNGVELADSETNTRYGWKKASDGQYIYTTYLKDKILNAFNGGDTLNNETLYVDLLVTEPETYDGILKNVAEISEMKDKDGKTVSKDVDSIPNNTQITRTGETINYNYTPTTKDAGGKYYQEVAEAEDDVDFEIIKLKPTTITIGGKVWLDVGPNDAKDDINNLKDSNESYDKIKENGEVTAILVNTKTNTEIARKTVNDDGSYEFTNVPKYSSGEPASYVVKFIYNGMDYTYVTPNQDGNAKWNDNSKVVGEEDRSTFNEKFSSVDEAGANATQRVTIEYNEGTNSSTGKYESKYKYNTEMNITAYTQTIDLSANPSQESLKHYNLGLKQRPQLDLALYKDANYATVTVNGQTETYLYDKFSSWNPEEQTWDAFKLALKDIDFGIRTSDINSGAQASIIYRLRVLNQSSVQAKASKIRDYFNNTYYSINNGEGSVFIVDGSGNEKTVPYNVDGNTVDIDLSNENYTLGNNKNYDVYIRFNLTNNAITAMSNAEDNRIKIINEAEISEYKTLEGIIDRDSRPGNKDKKENDTGEAPVITLITPSQRTLSGNVFEDLDTRINIKDIKVELVDITTGNEIVREGCTTTTDENGNYTFTNFLPGQYIVRFTYGDRNETVLTNTNGGSNEHSYNGQDYSSTDYDASKYKNNTYWYKDVTDKSDATDDISRRNIVNNYSKTYTNAIAEILNSWEKDPQNKEKIDTLINNTFMYANTAQMKLSVEYATETLTSNNIPTYEISGIDFGLKKRPTSEVTLEKHVTKLTLKSSSGETLVEATPERNGSSVQWMQSKLNMPNGLVKIEQEDAVLNGANIEIEYEITAKNTGAITTKVLSVVDYIDNNLRFDETINPDWQAIQAADLEDKNAIQELNDLGVTSKNISENDGTLVAEKDRNGDDIDLTKRQVIVVTKNTNPLVTQDIATGEKTGSSKITLTKTLTTSNTGDDDFAYNNIAEILALYNEAGRKTEESIPGNLNPDPDPDAEEQKLEPGEAKAEPVTISNPTGQSRVYYILGITIAVIMIAGIIAIKKFVIDKNNK